MKTCSLLVVAAAAAHHQICLCLRLSALQVMRWLNANLIDPRDPRNAALVELLKAQEAQGGSWMDGLFRQVCVCVCACAYTLVFASVIVQEAQGYI